MTRRNSPTRVIRDLDIEKPRHPIAHVGLAYEKLAPHSSLGRDGDKSAGNQFIRQLAEHSPLPKVYAAAFRRWVRRTMEGPTFEGSGMSRRVMVGMSQGRVLCGLGELTPTENGLSVHQTYGVPYLPGSSLKGITRAWLNKVEPKGSPWHQEGQAYKEAFGVASGEDDEDGEEGGESGMITFYDALWVPADKQAPDSPFAAEILTPHFGNYYSGGNKDAPDGTQSPIPVTFLAAQGAFRIVLEGPNELMDGIVKAVEQALVEQGIGAKSRSGYGRFVIRDQLTREDIFEKEERDSRAAAEKAEREERARAEEAERLAAELAAKAKALLARFETIELSQKAEEIVDWVYEQYSGIDLLTALQKWLREQEIDDLVLKDVPFAEDLARDLWSALGKRDPAERDTLQKWLSDVPELIKRLTQQGGSDSPFGNTPLKSKDFKKLFKRDGSLNNSHFEKLSKKKLTEESAREFVKQLEDGGAIAEAGQVREKFKI